MPLIYLEDIVEHGGNKYLAVNIAAKRAREINAENSLPMLIPNAEKPVTVAIDELKSGLIEYEELDQPEEPMDDAPFGVMDSEKEEGSEESQPTSEESQPTSEESQPTSEESQPTSEESQPTSEESQPTSEESQPIGRISANRGIP